MEKYVYRILCKFNAYCETILDPTGVSKYFAGVECLIECLICVWVDHGWCAQSQTAPRIRYQPLSYCYQYVSLSLGSMPPRRVVALFRLMCATTMSPWTCYQTWGSQMHCSKHSIWSVALELWARQCVAHSSLCHLDPSKYLVVQQGLGTSKLLGSKCMYKFIQVVIPKKMNHGP